MAGVVLKEYAKVNEITGFLTYRILASEYYAAFPTGDRERFVSRH